METHGTRYVGLALGSCSFSAFFAATGIQAGLLELADHPHQESRRSVHQAEHDVAHAWEVYGTSSIQEAL